MFSDNDAEHEASSFLLPNGDFQLLHDIDCCELMTPLELDQTTEAVAAVVEHETSLNQMQQQGICYLKTIGHNPSLCEALYCDNELKPEPASNVLECSELELYCLDNVEVLDCHEVSIENDYDAQSQRGSETRYLEFGSKFYLGLIRLSLLKA